MALPKIDVPTYELDLPISKQKVVFRPFLVKEQKILFMASESDDGNVIEKSMRQILSNCTLNDVNIEDLTLVDLEYFFIHLRARSVGEKLESRFKCENIVDGEVCGHVMEVDFDLTKITVSNIDTFDDTIKLTDKIGMKMKLPKYSVLSLAKDSANLSELIFDLVIDSIEYIYEGDEIFYAKEVGTEELKQFVENLNEEQFKRIQEYFNKTPKVIKNIDVKCAKCGYQHHIEFEGIESFFL